MIGTEQGAVNSRVLVARRLRERRDEIEQAMLCRARGIADPSREDENHEGQLREAVAEAFDHAVEMVGAGRDFARTPPASLIEQARLAARSEIPLDLILRRYFAAFARLSQFVLEEAEGAFSDKYLQSDEGDTQTLFQAQLLEFDRIVESVAAAYREEVERRRTSPSHRRTEQIKRLLAGESITAASLEYDLKGWHLALVVGGDSPDSILKSIAEALDRSMLRVQPEEGLTWVWLGGRHRAETSDLLEISRREADDSLRIAIGEPGLGLTGWRLSHWQAAAAFRHDADEEGHLIRYADVGLAACVQKDHVLAETLHQLFLDPLKSEKDGGETLRCTLKAYLSSGRNVSSAAAALGISRQTVASRLRLSEEKIGQPLSTCGPEIDIALRLVEFDKA